MCLLCDRKICSTTTEVFLARTRCDEGADAGPYKLELEAGKTGSDIWRIRVDASKFTKGVNYQVCIDHDGSNGPEIAGNAGMEVYISTIVRPIDSLKLDFTCVLDTAAPAFDGASSNPSIGGTIGPEEDFVMA